MRSFSSVLPKQACMVPVLNLPEIIHCFINHSKQPSIVHLHITQRLIMIINGVKTYLHIFVTCELNCAPCRGRRAAVYQAMDQRQKQTRRRLRQKMRKRITALSASSPFWTKEEPVAPRILYTARGTASAGCIVGVQV